MINRYLPVSDLKLGQMVEVDWCGSRTEVRVVGLELVDDTDEVIVTVKRGREIQHIREGEIYTAKEGA